MDCTRNVGFHPDVGHEITTLATQTNDSSEDQSDNPAGVEGSFLTQAMEDVYWRGFPSDVSDKWISLEYVERWFCM